MEGYKSQVLFQVENKISHSLCKIYEYFREKKGWKKSDSTRVLNLSILVQYFVVCNPLTPICVFVVHVYACVCLTVIFPIYGLFGAIRKPDSGRIVCKTYLIKTENRTKKPHSSHTTAWSKGTIFAKNANFLQKIAGISKIRGPWYGNIYFLNLHICMYLRAKFQISSIILTSFRQGIILPPLTTTTTLKRTSKKPTQISAKPTK